MTSIPIDFPSPAFPDQIYPDLDNGDSELENGKVYQYDSVKGVWDVFCGGDSEDGEPSGPGGSEDYLGRYGDIVATSDNVTYHWQTQGLIFSSDLEVKFNLDDQLGLKIDKEQVYSELPFTVNEDFSVLAGGEVLLGTDSNPFLATEDHHAVSKRYLDTEYVKKTGDTITGSLTFDKVSSPIVFDPEADQMQQIRVKKNTSGAPGTYGGLALVLQGSSDYNKFKIEGGPEAAVEFLSVGGNTGVFTFSTPVVVKNNVLVDSTDAGSPYELEVKGAGSSIKATDGAEIASNTYKSSSSNSDISFKTYGDTKLVIKNTNTNIFTNVKIDGNLDLNGNRLDSVSSISVPDNSVIKSPDTGQNYMVFDEPNRSINTFATTVPEHEIYVFQPIKTVCGVLIRDDYKRGTASDYLFRVQADRAITENSLSGATGGLRTSFGVLGNGVIVLGSDENDPFVPTRNHHAVSKYYVDTLIQDTLAGVDFGDNGNKVNVAGDTMTGNLELPQLIVSGDNPQIKLNDQILTSSVSVTPVGPLGPIQSPNPAMDFPDGNFVLNKTDVIGGNVNRMPIAIDDYIYKISEDGKVGRVQAPFGEGYDTGRTYEIVPADKFPVSPEIQGSSNYRLESATYGFDGEKMHILLQPAASMDYHSILISYDPETVHTDGWTCQNKKLWGGGSGAVWDKNINKFVTMLTSSSGGPVSSRIYTIDPVNFQVVLKVQNLDQYTMGISGENGEGLGYFCNGKSWFANRFKLLCSSDGWDTYTEIAYQEPLREFLGLNEFSSVPDPTIKAWAFYQGKLHVVAKHPSNNNFPGKSEDTYLFVYEDVEDPTAGIENNFQFDTDSQSVSSSQLRICGDYLVFTERLHFSIFDGEKLMFPVGRTPEQIAADGDTTRSIKGTYAFKNGSTNELVFPSRIDDFFWYISDIPESFIPADPWVALEDVGSSGESPRLEFNGDRVALYKELSGSIDLNQDVVDELRDHVDATFVKKADGDEMQGPLRVTGGRNPDDNGVESTVKALNIDSGQNSSLNLKHNGNAKIYVGDEQTSFQGHIKFNVAGKQIYSGANKKGLAFYDNGVQYVGDYTAAKHIVTKEKLEEAINNIPTGGGDSSDKVSKTGDTMTGKLILSNSNALDLRGKVQINGTTTNNRFLGTDGSGNTTWKTALTSQTQANWNTTSTGDASYIKNKPRVVTGSNNNISITSSNGNYYISG